MPKEHQAEIWFRLWSALCHQGTIFSASYAAVPHVVEIGARRHPDEQAPFWEFVGAVGSCTDRPAIPADLRRSYEDALQRCAALSSARLVPGVPLREGKGLLTALAGLGGLAALLSSIDDELTLERRACGEQTHVELASPPFGAKSEPPDPAIHAAAAQARVAGLAALAEQIEALDSAAPCASCGASLGLAQSVAYAWP